MAEASWVCSQCNRSEAHSFCLCSSADTFLCELCTSSHYSKLPKRLHIIIPTNAYGQHRAAGYFDRLQERLSAVPRRKEKLLTEVRSVQQCCSEFAAAVDSLIVDIRTFADSTIERLTATAVALEAEITEKIAMAEATMYFNEPELGNKWARFLRYAACDEAVPRAFQYCIDASAPLSDLKKVLEYRFGMKETIDPPQYLPGIYGNELRLYQTELATVKKVLLSVSLTQGCVYTLIESQRLICVGGSPASAFAYSINITNSNVQRIADMFQSRAYPGILPFEGNVYVFGGYKPSLDGCEVFDSVKSVWRPLPHMSDVRACFTPCRYQLDVFLFDIYVSQWKMEKFSLVTERFSAVEVDLTALNSYPICFVHRDTLIVATTSQVVKSAIGRTKSEAVVKAENGGVTLPAASSLLVVGAKAYFVDYANGNLFVFDAEANRWGKTTVVQVD